MYTTQQKGNNNIMMKEDTRRIANEGGSAAEVAEEDLGQQDGLGRQPDHTRQLQRHWRHQQHCSNLK